MNQRLNDALDRIGTVCQQLPEDLLIEQMARIIARVLPNVPHMLVMVDEHNDVTVTSNIKRDIGVVLLRETADKLESGVPIEDVD